MRIIHNNDISSNITIIIKSPNTMTCIPVVSIPEGLWAEQPSTTPVETKDTKEKADATWYPSPPSEFRNPIVYHVE